MHQIELPNENKLRELKFEKAESKGHFDLISTDKNGNDIIVSESDLIADMEWGHYYDLNHDVVSQAHRNKYNGFRKKYLATAYDKKIEELKNERILIQRLKLDHVDMKNSVIGEIYKDLLENMKSGNERSEQAGFLLETMITSLLIKISYDFSEKYDIEVEHATVEDDVEYKIDLIVKFKNKNRALEVDGESATKGIQLTLVKPGSEKYDIKKDQIYKANSRRNKKDKIDDLVLISVDLENREISKAYDEWKKRGEPAGGPEKFFKTDLIVNKILKGIFQETELDLSDPENKNIKNELWEYFEGK